MRPPSVNHKTFIGKILTQKKIITDTQLKKALNVQKQRFHQQGRLIFIGRIIVEMGFASESEVIHAINDYYNLSVSSLSENIEELIEEKNKTLLRRMYHRIGIPIWLQLLTAMITVIFITSVSLSYVILKQQKEQLYNQTVKIGMISLNYFANNARIPMIEDNTPALNSLIREAASAEGIRYAIIVNKEQVIKAHTDLKKIGFILKMPQHIGTMMLKGDITYFNYISPSGEHLLNLSRPLTFQNKELGEVHVGVSISFIEELIREKTHSIQAITTVIILTGAVLSVLLGFRFSRPVSKLVLATGEIAKGNYQHKVVLTRNDEFGKLAGAFNRMSRELWIKSLLEKSFGKYVGSEVLQLIRANPEQAWLKGRRSEATILFSDIRGFTSFSEITEPEVIVEELNRYFEVMTGIIHQHGGYVDKFIGDAVLAVFGVPIFQRDHVERAVKAAFYAQNALKEAGKRHPLLNQIGISLHSGVAVCGNIGSHDRMEYTVIGDSVNMASRLNGFAGSGEIIISKTVYDQMKDMIEVETLIPQPVKGKTGRFELFKLINFKEN